MSHFAKVVDGKVIKVIVAEQEFFNNFVDDSPGKWIQTSYNTYGGKHPENKPLRKNFAGIGFSYDEEKDAFIPPQPYPSWILDNDTCLWNPPIPFPNDGKPYIWNESTQTWDIVTESE